MSTIEEKNVRQNLKNVNPRSEIESRGDSVSRGLVSYLQIDSGRVIRYILATFSWARSSVGRASGLHPEGLGFESPRVHQKIPLVLRGIFYTEKIFQLCVGRGACTRYAQ